MVLGNFATGVMEATYGVPFKYLGLGGGGTFN